MTTVRGQKRSESNDLFYDGLAGRRLRRLRMYQGWSQKELAALASHDGVHVSERRIRAWENGEAQMRPGPASRAVASVFRVAPGYFFSGEKGSPLMPEED